METNRRTFVAGVTTAVAGVALAATATAASAVVPNLRLLSETQPIPEMRLDAEYGWAISYYTTDDAEVLALLQIDAAKHLPPGTRYEVRQRSEVGPGWPKGMAWYRDTRIGYGTNTDEEPEREPGHKEQGYALVGQYRTPVV